MKNAITTVQIHENVKHELDRLKEDGESYEEFIVRLIDSAERQKRKQKQLMIEGCKEMAEDNRKINKEWESADAEWPE